MQDTWNEPWTKQPNTVEDNTTRQDSRYGRYKASTTAAQRTVLAMLPTIVTEYEPTNLTDVRAKAGYEQKHQAVVAVQGVE